MLCHSYYRTRKISCQLPEGGNKMDYAQRRKLQGKETERRILNAALDLMRDRGFDKVSIRDICKEAGITTGAFYHHFPLRRPSWRAGSPLWTTIWRGRWRDMRESRRTCGCGVSFRLMPNSWSKAESSSAAIISGASPSRGPGAWTPPAIRSGPCWTVPSGGGGPPEAGTSAGVGGGFLLSSFPGRGHRLGPPPVFLPIIAQDAGGL